MELYILVIQPSTRYNQRKVALFTVEVTAKAGCGKTETLYAFEFHNEATFFIRVEIFDELQQMCIK